MGNMDIDKASLEELVTMAQKGDKAALEIIVRRFQGFIFKKAASIFVKDHELDDLIQIGNVSLVNAVRKFNVNGGKDFLPYVTLAIQNNYYYLIRGKAKCNSETSLNKKNEDGYELMNVLVSDEDIEGDFIKKQELSDLKKILNMLDDTEKEFIYNIFYQNISITSYANSHNIKYDKCIRMKKAILKKVRSYYENLEL